MCSYLDQVESTYYFRRAVPKDLIGFFKTKSGEPRTEWKFSLRVKDRETAKRKLRRYEIETDGLIDDARRAIAQMSPSELSLEDLAAQERLQEERDAKAKVEEARQKRRQHPLRREIRALWRERMHMTTANMTPEEAAIHDLLRESKEDKEKLRKAIAELESKNAQMSGERQRPRDYEPQMSLILLFERYAKSGTANPKTIRKWRSCVEKLVEHLGHNNARRVTRADLNGWVEDLVSKGLSKKTIVDGYLPAIRSAFDIAFENGDIPANPASGLKVRAPKAVKLRERDHSDEEAATILGASLCPQSEKLSEHHARARRWVPWLCAYTGARVGEITQMRAMDIQEEGGIWFVVVTPEAGSTKTNEARKVPLHSHLIEQGFTKFANANDATPLFHQAGAGNEVNPASKIRAADLASWARSLGVETPQPNHGWRHRFKTMARLAEVPEYIADKIQGHAPRHEGGKYGSVPLATLRDAIEKLPRYEVA